MAGMRPAMFAWREVDVVHEGGEIAREPAMVPHPRFRSLCARQFAIGEDYALGPVEGVPSRSRGGFFASVKEAWNNLPHEDERFPSAEHLRKRALVQAGWANHSQTVFDTPKDARKHAVEIRKVDEYAVIKVGGCVVDVWTAKSIAAGAITAEKFREVKTAALDWVATLARTSRAALERHAKDGGSR
jgi:hypothetical protein